MYILHIANKNYSSWSLRPWLLMQELFIPFQEKLTPFIRGSNRTAFREFCSSGLVPCLIDEDISIWDSMGIIEYLAENYPGVWPEDSIARMWARCASAEMHSGFTALREQCPMNCALRIKLHQMTASLEQDIFRIDELWNEGISRFGGPFLAGSKFTAVDAFFAPVIFRMQTFGIELSTPSSQYAKHMLSLHGMERWEEMAMSELWREEGHEQDANNAGVILKDYRKN